MQLQLTKGYNYLDASKIIDCSPIFSSKLQRIVVKAMGWMDGWMDGWMGVCRMYRWMDGWMYCSVVYCRVVYWSYYVGIKIWHGLSKVIQESLDVFAFRNEIDRMNRVYRPMSNYRVLYLIYD